MRIELKGTPPSLNKFAGRENTWEYREAKNEWTMKVWAMSFPQRPKVPYEKALVKITYYFPTAARHDADNYAGKFLLDGLTKAKIIVDDDLKHIATVIRGEVDRKNPRTVIEVTEIEETVICNT